MRVVLLALFIVSFAFSNANFIHPDFATCYKKNRILFSYHEDKVSYPIKDGLAILYSPEKKLKKYIKYDRFLGLYLVQSNHTKNLKFKSTDDISLGQWLGSADDESLYAGNFARKMSGFERLSRMASLNQSNGIVMCLCCDSYGISVGNGEFIETEYIKNFIDKKDDTYGSLGVRFTKRGEKVYVLEVDPFSLNDKLLVGDEILSFNGKNVKDISLLKREILFLAPKSKYNLKIKRGSKELQIDSMVEQRYGGGILSDTFLERFDLFFDKELNLVVADTLNLKVNDKLLKVNDDYVKTQADVREALSKAEANKIRLLFTRDGFEFFIELGNRAIQNKSGLKSENYGG